MRYLKEIGRFLLAFILYHIGEIWFSVRFDSSYLLNILKEVFYRDPTYNLINYYQYSQRTGHPIGLDGFMYDFHLLFILLYVLERYLYQKKIKEKTKKFKTIYFLVYYLLFVPAFLMASMVCLFIIGVILGGGF